MGIKVFNSLPSEIKNLNHDTQQFKSFKICVVWINSIRWKSILITIKSLLGIIIIIIHILLVSMLDIHYSACGEMDTITSVISSYQRRLVDNPSIPYTYGRAVLGKDGVANKMFLTFLCSNREVGVQLFKDVKFLRSKVVCETCNCDMSWCTYSYSKSGFSWRCRRKTSASVSTISTSTRHCLWFQQSNLTLMEVMLLTHGMVRRVPARIKQLEDNFGAVPSLTGQFCRGNVGPSQGLLWEDRRS